MQSLQHTTFVLAIILLISGTRETKADEKPVIFVAVPPYQSLVEKIGGEYFEVKPLVDESDDPHTFFPSPKDVAALAASSIYFTAGMPFEEELPEKLKASKTYPKIVNLLDGIELLEGSCDHDDHGHSHGHGHSHSHGHGEDHDHDHKHDHDHGELDPHVWLSPGILAEQVRMISSELTSATESPDDKAAIEENASKLLADITATDKELVKALAPVRGKTFYVYHGAFAYFAKAYGLTQKSVEINGRSPEPKELVELVKQAKKDEVSVIFVQPQFDSSSAESLAEAIGGTVVAIDPLAKDVLGNLTEIAAKIASE